MDRIVIVIIAAVVAVGAVFFARSAKPAEGSGLGFMQALGAGIVGLGILLMAMPYAAGAIAVLGFIKSSDFAILSGSVYAIAILALLGGLVLMFVKTNEQ